MDVTYDYYTGTYGGNTIPPERFNYFIRKAGAYIDYITFNRIKGLDSMPEEVKQAVCAIADSMFVSTGGTGIESGQAKSSEKVGDYQVTYTNVSASSSNSAIQSEGIYISLARRYLLHTGLMYRGLD